MTRAAVPAFPVLLVRPDPAPGRPVLSFGACPGIAPANLPARPRGLRPLPRAGAAPARLDPFALARAFPDRWSAWLRGTFRGHMEAALAFGVSERTARDWWDGVGAPRAHVVVLAARRDPGFLPAMEAAA